MKAPRGSKAQFTRIMAGEPANPFSPRCRGQIFTLGLSHSQPCVTFRPFLDAAGGNNSQQDSVVLLPPTHFTVSPPLAIHQQEAQSSGPSPSDATCSRYAAIGSPVRGRGRASLRSAAPGIEVILPEYGQPIGLPD